MRSDAKAIVRAFVESLAEQDYAHMSDALDPDVVWFGTRGGLDERRVIRGPEGVLDYLAEIQEPWERLDVVVEQLIEADAAVVIFLRETGLARRGSMEVQNETAMIIRVRGARIVELTGYLNRDDALRVVEREKG